MVQQDPGLLDQVMRTVASYDNAAGKLRGFRAYPGRNRAIFNKLGLKPGDLVTAINGQALDDPQHSQEVFNTIQTSDHVTVTIERGGQKQDISLNIAQVAAEATKDLEGEGNVGGGSERQRLVAPGQPGVVPAPPPSVEQPQRESKRMTRAQVEGRARFERVPSTGSPMMPKFIQSATPNPHGRAISALSVSLVSLCLPAVPPPQQDGATITPNYKDADLSQIIQAVSEVTGKNFIIDPRVNAKVTMLSSTPMSPAAFYEAFLAVLQVYGYVAVPAGKVIKIIPNTDARQQPSIDLPNNVSSTSDEMVTQIITMKNISAAQLVPLLRPLIPQQGHLAAYPSGNMLIISDRASNVSRIMKIIERMDESGDEPIEVIPLHNASATELVRTINSAEPRGRRRGRRRADQDRRRRAHQQRADQRREVLEAQGQGARHQLGYAARGRRRRHRSALSAVRRCRKTRRQAQGPGLRHRQSSRRTTVSGGRAGRAAGGGGSNVDASVTIWADVPTNALIMTAPPKIMKNLMAVIDKLDIRRAQVEVEALIVEVAVNKSCQYRRAVAPGRRHLAMAMA